MKPIMAAVALPMPLRKNRSSKMPSRDRAPADEDGGGIEIRHRRPAFQIHPRDQAGGMHQKSHDQERESIASNVCGQTSHDPAARTKIST